MFGVMWLTCTGALWQNHRRHSRLNHVSSSSFSVQASNAKVVYGVGRSSDPVDVGGHNTCINSTTNPTSQSHPDMVCWPVAFQVAQKTPLQLAGSLPGAAVLRTIMLVKQLHNNSRATPGPSPTSFQLS
jgi:hypothetical protein